MCFKLFCSRFSSSALLLNAVLLADDMLDGGPAVMCQMVDVYDYYKCSVLQVKCEDTREIQFTVGIAALMKQ